MFSPVHNGHVTVIFFICKCYANISILLSGVNEARSAIITFKIYVLLKYMLLDI